MCYIVASRLCRLLVIGFGFLLTTFGLICGMYIFPMVINLQVDKEMKLTNGSEAYQRWEKLPIPLKFKVYLFNVTNPEEVQLGKKPMVQEVGPFVYDQYRYKENIVSSQNGTYLSYNQKQVLFFNKHDSHPLQESEVLTIANVPLMAILYIAPGSKHLYNEPMNIIFDNPKDLFLRTTVKNFLFDGITLRCANATGLWAASVCRTAKERHIPQLKSQSDGNILFSLLSHKNISYDGNYTIDSGINDISALGSIKLWENNPALNCWNGSTCNAIFGTDATIFPPHVTSITNLGTYISDICRSVKLKYTGSTTFKNIDGLRFTADENMLTSAKNFTSNECFCNRRGKRLFPQEFLMDECFYDGALDLSKCFQAPIVMTNPHFHMADEKYKSTVDGLKPEQSIHSTFVEIEPTSGTILHGSKKAQFNIFYTKLDGFHLAANIKDSLMPVAWIDEGAELNDDLINLLNDKLFFPKKILFATYVALIAIGLTMGSLGFACRGQNFEESLMKH